MKFVSRFIVLALLAVNISCAGLTFNIVNKDFNTNGKKIAVVSGLNKEENLVYSAILTNALKKKSGLRVVSQKYIKSKLPHYPYRIKGPYLAYITMDTKYERTNLEQIKELYRKLNVDFIYVVWTPSMHTSGPWAHLSVVGQMFSFPQGKEIGRGDYYVIWKIDTGTGKPQNANDPLASMQKTAYEYADDIVKKMNIAK